MLLPSFATAADEGPSILYDPFTLETARTAGMGRVASVGGDGTTAMWWNPAGLAFRPEWNLAASNADFTALINGGDHVRSLTLSGPLPFGPKGLAGGIGFKRMQYDFEYADFDGDPIESSSFDNLYAASLAYPLSPHFSLGAQLEYLWSHPTDAIPELNIPEDVTGGAAALGIGVTYERPIAFSPQSPASSHASDERIVLTPQAGASLLHLGQKLEYSDQDEGADLFRQFRLGAGMGLKSIPLSGTKPFAKARLKQFQFITALEVFIPMVDLDDIVQESILWHWGAELSMFGVLSGRIGFIDDDDESLVSRDNTYGVGISLPDGLPFDATFDWASVPTFGTLRLERRTLSITFGRSGS